MTLPMMFRPVGSTGQRPTRPHGRALLAHPGPGAALRTFSSLKEI